MTEWKKVIYNRKIFFAIAVLFLAQLILPIMEEKRTALRWEQQESQSYAEYLAEQEQIYVDGFSERVENVIKQADSYANISIFSQEGSFSQKNAEKTRRDYQNLNGLQIEARPVRTVTAFFDNAGENICLILAAALAALAIIGAGNTKLRRVTYPTRFGRLRLAMEQGAALAGWAVFLSFTFGVGVLAENFLQYRENAWTILTAPAQSFFCFSDFPWRFSLAVALILYLLFRALVLYAFMLMIWAVTLACAHMVLTVLVLGVICAVEFLFYVLIDDANVWYLLKCCNFVFQILENDTFLTYKNLNIMGAAVSRAAVGIMALAAFGMLNFTGAVLLHCRCYPCSSRWRRFLKFADRLAERFEVRRARFLEKCSVGGMEIYRIFISGKGAFAILIFAVLIAWRADFTQIQRSASQTMYYTFMEEHTGEPDSESEAALEEVEAELKEVDDLYMEKTVSGELSVGESIELSFWYESYEQERLFAQKVRSETDALTQIKADSGIDVWYVNQYSYRHLLECDDAILNIALLLVSFWLCTTAYAGERASGMAFLVNGSSQRESLYRTRRRILLSFVSCLYVLVLCCTIFTVALVNGLSGGMAPVQSILSLADFPIRCTIWQYFAARFLVKYCLLVLLSGFVSVMSENILCKNGRAYGVKGRKSVEKFW